MPTWQFVSTYLVVCCVLASQVPGLPAHLESVVLLGEGELDVGRHEAVQDGDDDALKRQLFYSTQNVLKRPLYQQTCRNHFSIELSVTRYKSPNVYKSCPTMISLEK